MILLFFLLIMIFLPLILFRVFKQYDGEAIMFKSIAITSIVLVLFIILSNFLGFDIFSLVKKSTEALVDKLAMDKEFLEMMNIDNLDKDEVKDYLLKDYSKVIISLPGLLAILESLIVFGMYSFLSSVNTGYKRLKHIRYFEIPKKLFSKLIFIVFASFIAFKLPFIENEVLFASALIFVSFVFAIQGISLLFMYTYKMKISSYFAGIVTGLSFFSFLGFSVLSIFGILDIVLDLKDRIHEKGENDR